MLFTWNGICVNRKPHMSPRLFMHFDNLGQKILLCSLWVLSAHNTTIASYSTTIAFDFKPRVLNNELDARNSLFEGANFNAQNWNQNEAHALNT